MYYYCILNNLIHALQKMIGKFHQTTTIKRILLNLHLGIDHQNKLIRFQFDPIIMRMLLLKQHKQTGRTKENIDPTSK